METIVNNNYIIYLKFAKRQILSIVITHTQMQLCGLTGVLINLAVMIIPQCLYQVVMLYTLHIYI